MAKSGGGMGVLLLGGGALAFLVMQSKAKAATPAPPLPAPQPSTPSMPSAPSSSDDDDDEPSSPAPSAPSLPSSSAPSSSDDDDDDEPSSPAPAPSAPAPAPTKQLSELDDEERAQAIAAAKKAKATEDAKAAAAREPAPTPTSSAAKYTGGGMVTAPFSSMPAAKPSAPAAPIITVTYKPTPKPAALPATTAKPTGATTKVDLAAARRMAPDVAANIKNKGTKYDRKQLASFQEKAGLTADGIYGPLSVSALKHFGAAAPKALFKGSVATYTPPA